MAERTCPVWVGYFLASPVRKLYHNPVKILSPYIKDGMKVIDIGSAMGFFSIPAAKMVGKSGKVVCIDLQKEMLEKLEKRARKAKVLAQIELHHCSENLLGIDSLKNQIDFALAFAVLHEMNNVSNVFNEVNKALKPNSKMLIAEPAGHVTKEAFELTLNASLKNNFKVIGEPEIRGSLSALLEKK